MNACQNCGKLNSVETNFCRFCGTKFNIRAAVPDNPYDYAAPQPYAWKSDEFQTSNEARRTHPTDALRVGTQPFQGAGPLASRSHAAGAGYAIDPNYRCPRCGSSYLPVMERRISTAGWIVFAALLVFTVIFFWIGLLLKEEVPVCPVCRSRVS